jgi:putative hydrolase of the HAD superfamily
VPHDLTWAYEHDEAPVGHARFREIATLGALPGLVAGIG